MAISIHFPGRVLTTIISHSLTGRPRDLKRLVRLAQKIPAIVAVRRFFDSLEEALKRGDAAMIREVIPDASRRLFLVSGPPGMVNSAKAALRSAGVHRSSIRTDYFPGYPSSEKTGRETASRRIAEVRVPELSGD